MVATCDLYLQEKLLIKTLDKEYMCDSICFNSEKYPVLLWTQQLSYFNRVHTWAYQRGTHWSFLTAGNTSLKSSCKRSKSFAISRWQCSVLVIRRRRFYRRQNDRNTTFEFLWRQNYLHSIRKTNIYVQSYVQFFNDITIYFLWMQ